MEQAQNALGFGRSRREGEDTAAVEKMFTPEFRNRLDAVISFAALPKEVILQVVEKFVLQLEAQLMDRNVQIELSPEAAEWLADKGYDDKMGARPLGRVIQEHIKKPLAEELLVRQARQGRHRAGAGAERRDRAEDRAGRGAADHGEEAAAAHRRISGTRAESKKGAALRRLLFVPAVGGQTARISFFSSTRSTWARSEPRLRMRPSMPITAYWPWRAASRGRFSMR